jgi:glycerophosphoryl diester phosphodiesterase
MPLIQLLDAGQMRPADVVAAGGQLTYGQMITPAGLGQIKTYASAIGAWKRLIIPEMLDGGLSQPTSLIRDAHAAGLAVHAWTFRNEPRFLAANYGNDPLREYQQFMEVGVDGVITDFPDSASRAIARF